MESVNCLKEGYNLEDLPRYLETLELRKMIHRASVNVNTLTTVEQEIKRKNLLMRETILECEEYLTTVRKVQRETLEVLQSRMRY